MRTRLRGTRFRRVAAACRISGVAGMLLLMSGAPAVAAQSAGQNRADSFSSAAKEFNVPEQVLLAVSYNESRWTPHGNGPSSDNGYGLMDLRTKQIDNPQDGRGDAKRPVPKQSTEKATRYTLDDAAKLLNTSPDKLKSDEQQNIRGGAAVLADYARQLHDGKMPSSLNDWYDAVAAYSGSDDSENAQAFADDVYSTMQQGADQTTPDGQKLKLNALPQATMKHGDISKLLLPGRGGNNQTNTDCPAQLNCRFVPAAYAQNSSDPADYGSYDPANRPKDMKIKYIVIHDTEGSYQSAIDHFQDPNAYVSANYVIRSNDGAVTEMVRPTDVSWGAGDWYVNMHAINIEHEGFAAQGSTWYTEAMYRSSAKLVRYLADKYNIPLDRQHVIGHDNVPTLSPGGMAGQHWDPGPYWDWNHYMDLLDAPITDGPNVSSHTKVLTIAPKFATNQPPIQDCSTGTCTTLPAQGSNLVYLRTQPNASAPLLSDPYMHTDNSAGTTSISDWSASANAGDQFAVADQQGDWTGIWYGGKVGWFFNPDGNNRTAHAAYYTKTVTPKAGKTTIPVYGGAYPESAAYPSTIPDQSLTPLYNMPAGQRYVTGGTPPTDYFYDATINFSKPDDHKIVKGNEVYYQVSFNHRQGFVKASDVDVHNN